MLYRLPAIDNFFNAEKVWLFINMRDIFIYCLLLGIASHFILYKLIIQR